MSNSKVALVTGGSRGIGKAIVELFAKEGWKVAACSRSMTEDSAAHLSMNCDVRQSVDCKRTIEQTVDVLGRLDAVINNAGLAGSNPLESDSTDELWHDIIDVNLHGTYFVSKYSIPHLPAGTGRIINIASVLGLKGVPDQTAYTAAKHGVVGLTKAMAQYLADKQVTVNAICPGWVRTEMAVGRMRALGWTEEKLQEGVPLNRFIEPEEVAAFTHYLCSDAAKNITGQALTIDGGVLA